METLKTAFVVVLLLIVLFGVYTVLNKPDGAPPKEIAWDIKGGPEALSLEISAGTGSTDKAGTSSSAVPDKKSASFDLQSPQAGHAAPSGSSSSQSTSALNAPGMSPHKESEKSLAPSEASRSTMVPVPVPDLTPGGKSHDGPVPSPTSDRDKPAPSRYEWSASGDTRNSSPRNDERSFASPSAGFDPSASLVRSNDNGRNFTEPTRESSSPNANGRPPLSEIPNRNRDSNHFENANEHIPSVEPTSDAPQVQVNPHFAENKPAYEATPASSSGSRYTKTSPVDRAIQLAQTQMNDNKWRDALLHLSLIYSEPDLTTAERNKLLDLLDPLAAKVVYSNEHLADSPYVVQRGDTLSTISKQFNVPIPLLQNINGVRNPDVLVPGTQLKVVRGPFRAEVDLNGKELTLYVQRMYAGRFPVSVGSDPLPSPGEYEVRSKESGRTYYGRDGQNISMTDPRNPYGRCWIDLGREVCIHGSSQVETGNHGQGCVGLSPQDADDVYGILSQGSKVLIRR